MVDLCWNGLGQGHRQPGTVGKNLGDAIKENKSIIHFDLSFNKIGPTDTIAIGQGLMTNNSLYGFHFRGNSGKVDSLGFLKVNIDGSSSQMITDHHLDRPINGVRPTLIGKKKQRSPVRIGQKYVFNEQAGEVTGCPHMKKWETDDLNQDKDQCWVCESWVESAF